MVYGILNQASIASNRGANLLRKFAASTYYVHTISPSQMLHQTNKGCRTAPLIRLVERTGFEPVTPTLPVLCAPNCANAPPYNTIILSHFDISVKGFHQKKLAVKTASFRVKFMLLPQPLQRRGSLRELRLLLQLRELLPLR